MQIPRPSVREGWWRFAGAAVLCVGFAGVFVVWLRYEVGGQSATIAVVDFGEAVAAMFAAGACAWAAGRSQGRLRRAWAFNAVADSAFSYLNATNNYGAIGSELDAGWVIGYLMIGLSALWPTASPSPGDDDKPIDVWQLALPWLAILLAAVVLITGLFRHRPIDVFSTVLI